MVDTHQRYVTLHGPSNSNRVLSHAMICKFCVLDVVGCKSACAMTICADLQLILNAPISEWPRVDCLMSWYSDGFPLHKAQQYADLTRPFLINDLHMQVSPSMRYIPAAMLPLSA